MNILLERFKYKDALITHMKRKVIKQGHNTLTLTLPRKWCDKLGIKSGDEIDIDENESSLVINSQGKAELETAELDVSNLDPMILRYTLALYKKGIDEINVFFDKPELINKVQKAIGKEAVGYEIIKQSTKSCLIKCVTDVKNTEFDNLLKRTFLLLLNMSEESLKAIKEKDSVLLKNAAYLEEANNRFTTALRRLINKEGHKDIKLVGPIYYIIEELERIADQYKYLCNYLSEKNLKKQSISNKVLALYEKKNKLLRNYFELFYKYDKNKVVEMSKSRKEIVKQVLELWDKKNNNLEFILLHYILLMTDKIFSLVDPYLLIQL